MSDLNIILARSGKSIKIYTSNDTNILSKPNIVLTDMGDIGVKSTANIIRRNNMVLSNRSVISTGTEVVYRRGVVQTVVSQNGLWSLVLDGKANTFTLYYYPFMSAVYGKHTYTTEGRSESGANLEKYCKEIDNNHQLCRCSGTTEAMKSQCVKELGIDPVTISQSQLNILSNQCPCINSNCDSLFKTYKGRNRLIDELGPITANSPGACPINVITTICSNTSIVEDSTIKSGDNIVTQQCGTDFTSPPAPPTGGTEADTKLDTEKDTKTEDNAAATVDVGEKKEVNIRLLLLGIIGGALVLIVLLILIYMYLL